MTSEPANSLSYLAPFCSKREFLGYQGMDVLFSTQPTASHHHSQPKNPLLDC